MNRIALRIAGLAAALAIAATACTGGRGGSESLTWDLRQPTTTRQLGGISDYEVVMSAPIGGALDVTIMLPQTTVRGTYRMAVGTLSDVTNVGPNTPIGIIQLYEISVSSVTELRALVDRFDTEWPLQAGERTAVDAALDEMAAKEAASGRITLDDYPLVMAWGFDAEPKQGVQASLTISVNSGGFSAYRVLLFGDTGA